MKKFLSAGLLCALLICPASQLTVAQTKREPAKTPAPCPHAETQYDLTQCAGREYKKADAELNRVYQQLASASTPEEQAKLKVAQLAWLKFRDAQCDFESVLNVGGTMYPMVVALCLADVTATRTRQLRESLEKWQAR